ncbi:MAG: right-handed parallel beta-helix repeat-containing protein [Pegethrix bostrychoides GSE-TBD4-15B]|uniref:Right-handed parallel beta-helix repeat-containing protein n=1 Tax=Pegethrix bostrychoides GSE-TBD4-15B TaxID=2839662 RepID=A0A951PBP6_9CYAN|nr:right-handed parallel beta-helix repeat-containing protein [Pegethrix bostrychoides GSE-TBD4-15B]
MAQDAPSKAPEVEPEIEPEVEPEAELEPASSEAVDLRIVPRLGIGHSSSGGGYDGTTRFEGFLPLRQDIGRNLTFLSGNFLLDNDANIGGNLVLGHRIYDAKRDRIWGGYLGFDNRATDDNHFYQLGAGFESLGEVIDFRVNGYLPIGDTSDLLRESSFDSGSRVSSGFQGNLLVLANERTRRTTQLWESALGGFDAEVGARLLHWNNGSQQGDLRAYGGLYYYGGQHSDDTLGWRVRVAARPIDTIELGAALQGDELFGTNFSVSAGISWPRVHPTVAPEAETVATRLGEPIERQASIVVNQDEETEESTERTERPLMNPEEERPYRFQHVMLGRNGGDGTFENPFGTVQAALDATRSDGNAVVYVDQGNNANIPAFTIPDRVRVLSQGPAQILAGMPFPGFPRRPVRLPFSPTTNFNSGIAVRLPLSNDGRFPRIQDPNASDLVTLNNRNIISGFRIANAGGNAIAGQSISNTEIRDNTITNAGERGIFLDEISDSVVMFDNAITGSRGRADSGQGIYIRDSAGSTEITIARHSLRNNRVGIEVDADGDIPQRQSSSQVINIDRTTIQNSREQGVRLDAQDFGNQIVSFTNGSITNSGAEGVLFQTLNNGSLEGTIDDSVINSNGSDGIRVVTGSLNGATAGASELFIRRNQITNNQGDGISVTNNELIAQELAIDSNQILNNGGTGIRAVSNNSSFQEYVTDAANGSEGISNNTITGNGSQGISLTVNDSSTVIADIKGNSLSENRSGRPDIEVSSTNPNADVCVVALDNNSPAGIRLDNNSTGISGLFEVGDLSTVSVRNIGTVEFRPNRAFFTDKPGFSSCFQ